MANIESLNIIFKDEQGTDLNKYGITEDNGLEKQVKLRRLANITQKGTPLNAQNLNSLKDKINEVVNKANTNETEISNALTNAKSYTDQLETKVSQTYETKTDATTKLESAKSYSDTNKQNAITSANTYTDQKVKKAIEDLNSSGDTNLGLAKAYTDQKVSDGVKQAKTYTDTEIGKINSDLVLKVECDHAVEITGQTNHEYNLAIPDESSVVITKIQGHSRRKSLNLLSLKPGTYAGVTLTYDNATGIYTFNGSSTGASILLNNSLPQGTKVSFIAEVVSGSVTGTNGISVMIDGTWIATDWVNNKTLSESISGCWMSADVTFTNYKVKINAVGGTYTNETMPMFQPYDNTFANSNNVLISTGRNLVDVTIPELNGGGFVTFMENITLPKGKYDFLFVSDTKANDTFILSINDLLLSRNGTFNKRGSFTLDKAMSGALTGWNNVDQTNVKLCIWYGWDGKHTSFEPYKEDTITSIGALGEFDYILPQSNQKVIQTSQVVTLNGSENWKLHNNQMYTTYFDNFNIMDGVDNLPNNSPYRIRVGGGNTKVAVHTEGAYTDPEVWKQYLKQNPIKLVYKLATPTYETVSVPSGYKVSNGGMQLQVGDVPYTLYKEYAVSLRSQVENNAQINVQQQVQFNELESKTNNVYNKSEVDTKVEEINTNLKKINTSLNNKQDTLNRDSNVEVYSIKATTLNGKLISNLDNSANTNYFTYHCSVSISDSTLYFTFITNTKNAPKNEEQWQWLEVFCGSGAISDTGSNINSYRFSILKQGVWFMWLKPQPSSLTQSFQPQFFKCTDVRISYTEDMFGNRYNTDGQLIS